MSHKNSLCVLVIVFISHRVSYIGGQDGPLRECVIKKQKADIDGWPGQDVGKES